MIGFWFAFIGTLAISATMICFAVVIFSAWVVAIGIAREEGSETLALFLLFSGVVLGGIFLIRHKRYRKAPWIGKFLWGGIAALVLVLGMALVFYGFGGGRP